MVSSKSSMLSVSGLLAHCACVLLVSLLLSSPISAQLQNVSEVSLSGRSPAGVAVLLTGDVIVTLQDGVSPAVLILNPSSSYAAVGSVSDDANPVSADRVAFNDPEDVIVDYINHGNALIADTYNSRVVVLSCNYTLVRIISSDGAGTELSDDFSIALLPESSDVVIADSGHNTLVVVTAVGDAVRTVPASSLTSAAGIIAGVCVNVVTGELVTLFSGNPSAIIVSLSNGTVLYHFTQYGVLPGSTAVSNPIGCKVDADQRLYVSDDDAGAVFVLQLPSGALLTSLSSTALGGSSMPYGVALSPFDNTLLLALADVSELAIISALPVSQATLISPAACSAVDAMPPSSSSTGVASLSFSSLLSSAQPPSSTSSAVPHAVSSSLPPAASLSSSAGPVSVVGDPQFVGLLGQSYQVHGVDGFVYNLISDQLVTVNAQFTFLDHGECQRDERGRPLFSCWSHPGSYISAVSVRLASGATLLLQAGSAQQGVASIELNGVALSRESDGGGTGDEDSETTVDGMVVQYVDKRTVRISGAGLFSLSVQNSDGFLNIERLAVRQWQELKRDVQSHGLIGQTWRAFHAGRQVREVEGRIDDYVVDDGLLGCLFVYSKMSC